MIGGSHFPDDATVIKTSETSQNFIFKKKENKNESIFFIIPFIIPKKKKKAKKNPNILI
jgi:hypothetical protein